VLSADAWQVSRLETWAISVLAVLTCLVIIFVWGPYTYKRSTRWIRVAAYWEREIENVVGVTLPEGLRAQNYISTGGWFIGKEPGPNKPLEPWYSQPVYVSTAFVTAMLSAIFVAALISKSR
jgi:hypothetical protein